MADFKYQRQEFVEKVDAIFTYDESMRLHASHGFIDRALTSQQHRRIRTAELYDLIDRMIESRLNDRKSGEGG